MGKLDNFGFGHGNHGRSCAHLSKNEPYQGILDLAGTLDILEVFECLQHILVFWLVADLVPSWLSTGQILCKVERLMVWFTTPKGISNLTGRIERMILPAMNIIERMFAANKVK